MDQHNPGGVAFAFHFNPRSVSETRAVCQCIRASAVRRRASGGVVRDRAGVPGAASEGLRSAKIPAVRVAPQPRRSSGLAGRLLRCLVPRGEAARWSVLSSPPWPEARPSPPRRGTAGTTTEATRQRRKRAESSEFPRDGGATRTAGVQAVRSDVRGGLRRARLPLQYAVGRPPPVRVAANGQANRARFAYAPGSFRLRSHRLPGRSHPLLRRAADRGEHLDGQAAEILTSRPSGR